MLHQAAMLIIFFIAAVPKDSQRFPKRCASTTFFYAISLRLVNGKAYRQYGLFFYAVSFQSVNSKACGSMAKRTATKMA